MAKFLYYDASAGISGDMNLGALVDLGVDFGYLCGELEKLNLRGEFRLQRREILKRGIRATKIDVVCAELSHESELEGFWAHGNSCEREDLNSLAQDEFAREGENFTRRPCKKFKTNLISPKHRLESKILSWRAGFDAEKSSAEGREISRARKNKISSEKKHKNPHAHFRNFAQICELIEASSLNEFVKNKSREIFLNLARAEAKIHGVSVRDVHFHEVGATDSIVDIVGAAICLEALGDPQIYASKIELGGGFARCAHGVLSVPAPATTEILKGAAVSMGRADFEMTTPTGAAILKTCALNLRDQDRQNAPRNFKILGAGYGAGEKDADFANALRVMLCESDESEDLSENADSKRNSQSAAELNFKAKRNLAASACEPGANSDAKQNLSSDAKPNLSANLDAKANLGEISAQTLIATNIDDMDAESFALACEILRENGALDVFSRSIFMKKGRIGFELNALCRKQDAARLKSLIFTHTSAIGVREIEVAKTELKREFTRVRTKFGSIGLKISRGVGYDLEAAQKSDEKRNLRSCAQGDLDAKESLNVADGQNLQSAEPNFDARRNLAESARKTNENLSVKLDTEQSLASVARESGANLDAKRNLNSDAESNSDTNSGDFAVPNHASEILKIKPEFDECKAAALAHGVTIAEVRAEALRVYDETTNSKK